MPRSPRRMLLFASLVLACLGTTVLSRAEAPKEQAPLIAIISATSADKPSADKALACKQLAVCGDAEAVPALAKLLGDPQLSSWARIALEAIPASEAGAALVESIDQVQGPLLVGVINSIGVRREAGAVAKLVGTLRNSDAEIASASAVALGRIAAPDAIAALRRMLEGAPEGVRSAVAQGCIECAEQLLASGKEDEALEIYDQVRRADVPKSRRLEATRGAILAGSAASIPLLVEQLSAESHASFAIGLTTARELKAAGTAQALVDQLKKATPSRQAALLSALADRGDASALPQVIALYDASEEEVRLAAARATAQLGDASCVAPLLRMAARSEGEAVAVALASLERLKGDRMNSTVAEQLGESNCDVRRLALELAGRRRIDAALPQLLQAAEDADARVRAAAFQALGATIGPDHLQVLIKKSVVPDHAEDASPAMDALRTAAVRMPDRDACADALIAALDKASPSAHCALLEVVGMVGGPHAVEALGQAAEKAAREANLDVQDVASRVLGEWMTADAAPPLLRIARGESEEKFRIRALRGYLRIARQFRLSDAERATMCQEAIKAAQRAEEKKLALEILERYPSLETLQAAIAATSEPDLKEPASAIALAMAPKLQAHASQVSALLQKAGL